MTNFNGQTAVITGGAQGIGLSTAERLINNGCEVMICDMDEKLGNESAERLNCHFLKVNLTNENIVEQTTQESIKKMQGKIFSKERTMERK